MSTKIDKNQRAPRALQSTIALCLTTTTRRIAVIESGEHGLRLAEALAQQHNVRLLPSQAAEPSGEVALATASGPLTVKSWEPDRLITVNSVAQACRLANWIMFTSPGEFGGNHPRYNAILFEATLAEALSYNSRAAVAIYANVPLGFSDRICREYGLSQLLHVGLTPHFGGADRLFTHPRLTIGGEPALARDLAQILQRAFGVRYRGHLVQRRESEGVAELAIALRGEPVDKQAAVLRFALENGLDHRVLMKCLGLSCDTDNVRSRSNPVPQTPDPTGLIQHAFHNSF